jgi:ABC-2 type transport system permease protein
VSAWIVFRREVGQYFGSPFAYAIAFAVLLLTGVLFNRDLVMSVSTTAADPSLVPVVMSFAMIFFSPLLTMRLFAEERREGTLELLLTAPVSDGSIVAGKFFGAWFYYSILLALTFLYQFVLLSITQPDLGHAIGAYLGIWLYGGATLAVGLFFSALTENQIAAAFASMVALMLLWLGDQAGQLIQNIDVALAIRSLTLQGHFSTSFAAGLIRAEDIVFFSGIIAVVLFMTIRVVESNRYR